MTSKKCLCIQQLPVFLNFNMNNVTAYVRNLKKKKKKKSCPYIPDALSLSNRIVT